MKGYRWRQFLKRLFLPVVLLLIRLGLFSRVVPFLNWSMRFAGIARVYNEQPDAITFGRLFAGALASPATDAQTAVFFVASGANDMHVARCLLLAQTLKQRGHRSEFLVCRSAVPVCPRDSAYRSRRSMPFFCYECYNGFEEIQKLTDISLRFIRPAETLQPDVTKAIEVARSQRTIADCMNFSFRDIPIGLMARKSVLYFLTRGDFTGDAAEVDAFRTHLVAGITFVDSFSRSLPTDAGVQWLILGNGSLLLDRIAAELATRRGIDYVTQEFYDGTSSWVYKKNGIAIDMDFGNEWQSFKETPLTPQDRAKVEALMSEKQSGRQLVVPMNDPETRGKWVRDRGDERLVCLFTNFAWDTTVLGRDRLFESMRQWLRETITFWNRSQFTGTLVIRAHPAETRLAAPSAEYVRDMIGDLVDGDRVVLIDSTDEVNSYDLIDAMDFGVVYASTIGLEIAHAGKSCLVAGLPHYLNQPFVVTPSDRNDYFTRFSGLCASPTPTFHRDDLLKYLGFVYLDRVKQLVGVENNYREARTDVQVDDGLTWLRLNEQTLDAFCKEIGA